MGERFKDVGSAKRNILETLKTASGAREDIAFLLYHIIAADPGNEAENLRYLFEVSEDVESNDEVHVEKVFSEEEKYKLKSTYGKVIRGALESLLQKGLTADQFYAELWEFISENKILDDEKVRAFALFYIWIDVRIPYFELDPGMKMSNEEYRSLYKKLSSYRKKARFILNLPGAQRTERASRLLDMLDEFQDVRERTVLMTQILRLSDRSEMLLARLLKERGGEIEEREDKG